MSAQKMKTKGTPDAVDVHVGKRLKTKRTLLGLSQEKLAESLDLTFQQIQKYERGMNRISAGRLYELSRILEIPVTYFYEGLKATASNVSAPIGMSDNTQESFGGSSDDDVMNRKETLDLVRLYYSIENEKTRKDIVKFIKSMAANTES